MKWFVEISLGEMPQRATVCASRKTFVDNFTKKTIQTVIDLSNPISKFHLRKNILLACFSNGVELHNTAKTFEGIT